jgi:hypothetical protein
VGIRPAAGCPEAVGVAGGDPAAVNVDLVVDELEVFLYLGRWSAAWCRC